MSNTRKEKIIDTTAEYGGAAVGAAIGAITNTVLTLAMLYFCSFIGVEGIIQTFMAINFPIEVVASAVIVPILVNAVKRFKHEV